MRHYIAVVLAGLALVLALGVTTIAKADTVYGAWTTPYYYGLSAPTGSHLGYALVGIKHELAYNGYGAGLGDQPAFGIAARSNTKAFQRANGLYADGVIGPKTAKVLFRKRAAAWEAVYGIVGGYSQRIKTLESANDPNAIGYVDHDDHGLEQINLRFHPDITVAQAIDPAFSIPWEAQHLRNDYNSLGDWDAALAAHNIGTFYATKWLAAGKPASGFVLASGVDIYTVATKYVALVKGQVL